MIESKGHKITPIDGDLAVSRNAEIGGNVDIHGKARVAGSLKVEGFLDAPHIKGAAKGLFNSVEELAKEYPNPRPGWFAIVLDATNKENGILYKAENRVWVATTDEARPYEFIKDSINVFALKEELANEVADRMAAVNDITLNSIGTNEYDALSVDRRTDGIGYHMSGISLGDTYEGQTIVWGNRSICERITLAKGQKVSYKSYAENFNAIIITDVNNNVIFLSGTYTIADGEYTATDTCYVYCTAVTSQITSNSYHCTLGAFGIKGTIERLESDFTESWKEQRFDTIVEFKPKDSLYYAIERGIKIGDDVNNVISNPTSSNNYKSIVLRCSEFDSFKLSYYHGSALSWMFTDKDGHVTGIDATPDATEIIDAVIEVPTGSDKLYFQTYKRSSLNPCVHYVKGNIRAVEELKSWSEETFIKYESAIEVIKQENTLTIDGKNWTTRTLYTAKEDEIIDVEMVLSDDCYVRDEYQAPGTSYSTYRLDVYSGENRKATLFSETGNKALNNKTKKAENVQLQAGDSLVYGDRIVGMYTTISVKVKKNIVNVISDNISDIKELEVKIEELEVGDFTEKQSGYVHAQTYTKKRLCLAHFSDIHMSTLGLQRFNEWCSLINANSLFIKDKLITGDYVYGWDDSMAWWDTNGGSNILGCIGNHEIQTYIDGGLTGVQKTERIGLDAYNKFIKPYISNWGILGTVSVNNGTLVYSSSNPTGADIYKHIDADTEGYSFYFKDYAEPKVRLIVLDWTNYNSPQKQWMQAVLADAKGKEYSIIVASHFPSKGIVKSNNTFDAFYKNSIASDPWFNIFTEYDAHEDIQNFIDGGGKFICWLCGHYHLDNWGFLDGYPMQLCIDVASAQVREAEGDIYHLYDTTFNLFSVDTTTEILYVNRIGANKTMYGYNRDCIAWDYKNHRLIREGK